MTHNCSKALISFRFICIGLSGADFPQSGELVGQFPGSYCIDQDGDFSYGKKGTWKKGAGGHHANGDVIGCVLLIPKSGGRSIFFTKNGGLNIIWHITVGIY
jgi:hypothetical protein